VSNCQFLKKNDNAHGNGAKWDVALDELGVAVPLACKERLDNSEMNLHQKNYLQNNTSSNRSLGRKKKLQPLHSAGLNQSE
jgi:hypothetical protein